MLSRHNNHFSSGLCHPLESFQRNTPLPVEFYPLFLKSQTLNHIARATVCTLADAPLCIYNTVPRQCFVTAHTERITNLAGITRVSGQSSHLSIGSDPSDRYAGYNCIDICKN